MSPASAPPVAAFRYAVVEDEPVARLMLTRMLATLAPDAVKAWEAADGMEAFHRLMLEPVHVLFLDIVFPPEGAFPFLERVRDTGLPIPDIVFVTSLEDQARKAFDWAACDYLVKPLSPARVKASLDRIRARRAAADPGALLAAVKGLSHATGPERFTVAIRDRILVFRWSEVLYLTTELRQVYAHTARGKVPLDKPLDELEQLLGDTFVRIHRSSLVNLDYLVEVHNPAGRAGEAVMQDGAALSVSRPRMETLLQQLARMR
ncbi:MAG TPA: LytTR family DNA-binding domain-containing protein [Holophagaceae bacterium]|nr:LytTR family DNA-binding domain-containing protein [Holophagaceae bacterium]